MVVVLGIVAVVGLVVAIVALVVQLDRKRYKGISMFQRHAIATRGLTGEATILDRVEVSVSSKGSSGRILYHLGDFVLEVRMPGRETYRAPCRQELIGSQWMDMREGKVVPVRVDPEDPQRVLVDVPARIAARDAARQADKEAHAKRQAELLNGRD